MKIDREKLSRILYQVQRRGGPLLLPGVLFLMSGIIAWGISQRFTPPMNPWPMIKSPIGDAIQARSIGGYTAGCLVGGVSLPPDGPGFQLMRLTRRRFYGNPMLVDFIMKLADRSAKQRMGTLLIGDLGQPRGGPTNSNHASHQSGLDVDIWYWRPPFASKRSLTLDEREALSAPSFVTGDGEKVNSAWTPIESRLLKAAASFDAVERIFVHAAIKRHLCQTEPPNRRDWLRKIRPWYGHDDHFHVRLRCPPGHPECQVQEATPPGDGCDSSLDWWFGEEAKRKGSDSGDKIQPVPKLPPECDRVLAGTL